MAFCLLLLCAQNKTIPVENTTDCLAIMSTICKIMVEQPAYHDKFTTPTETIQFCQRVMVASIIVYDHVHVVGAFSKKNNSIDVRLSRVCACVCVCVRVVLKLRRLVCSTVVKIG